MSKYTLFATNREGNFYKFEGYTQKEVLADFDSEHARERYRITIEWTDDNGEDQERVIKKSFGRGIKYIGSKWD